MILLYFLAAIISYVVAKKIITREVNKNANQ